MKGWNKFKLEQLSEFITKGSTPTTFGFNWVENGIPFLRSECVTDEGFDKKGLSFITVDAHNYMERSKVIDGDILISITGNVGRIAIFPEQLKEGNINQHIARVRINNFEICDKYFIYYQLIQESFRHFCNGIVTGAAYPQLSLKQIRETPIFLPPLPIQHRIASILSAYDDLIENNLKRIKLLEELAQRTYEEWFVKFKFPGHENTAINKETGLPVDWEKVKLGDLCEKINYGYTASATYSPIGPKFLRITDIVPDNINWQNVPYCEIHEKDISKYLLLEGDIVIARTGATVGYAKRINKHHKQVIFASYLIRLRMQDKLDNIIAGLYIESKNFKNYVLSVAGGAAQPNANAPVLTGIIMVVPKYDVQKKFRSIIEPILDLKEMLLIQNTNLKESRDILLPRLMSGVIEVDK